MLRYTVEQIEEVSVALATERENVEMFKRLQALSWRMQGVSSSDVALQSGFSISKVARICANYMSSGIAGLRNQYKGSQFRKLSKEAEAAAFEKLSEKAKSGQFVRVSELQAEFEKDTGVHYHPSAFYDLLARHDWRKVMPRRRHPKAADEATCEASKKLTL